MKTILKLIVAALLCVADLSAGNSVTKPTVKDPYHLIVEGEFIAQKNIHYTVYKLDAKSGLYKSEYRNKTRRYFYLECDRGARYLVRFQDKKGNIKFLMIEATREGYFGVNVDFNKSYDAVITYSKNGYMLTALTNAGIPDIAQN